MNHKQPIVVVLPAGATAAASLCISVTGVATLSQSTRHDGGPHDVRQDHSRHLPAVQVHTQEWLFLPRMWVYNVYFSLIWRRSAALGQVCEWFATARSVGVCWNRCHVSRRLYKVCISVVSIDLKFIIFVKFIAFSQFIQFTGTSFINKYENVTIGSHVFCGGSHVSYKYNVGSF